ncbi:centrosomal protein of 72 kDa-like isoform X2 [Pteropus vampyrus]|uniref:Centrosomal protein of 72 kDa-like isoform X2 n=1 Tax=Pteropus vampyrus TaxID=132908 RepID=A0A6P6C5Q5_PTEVA|nr:centrosomal protein of 72 kDa-like isoform X2 [Pteropus vampyrus]
MNQFSILSCAQGIQYLAALESLNLYYNCISLLAEVFRLHSLKELADVDFRLNPVVKNEPDYRLFVVRLLPKLRQLGRCHAPACSGGPGGVCALRLTVLLTFCSDGMSLCVIGKILQESHPGRWREPCGHR